MKAFNFVSWVDKNVRCAVHTVVPKRDAPSSFVKVARAAKKSRFSSLKTVGAEELDSAELLEATLELETAELLDATDEEDFALLLEDLALELLTAERSSGILVIQWLSMSLQSDWRRDSIIERFE